MRLDIFGRKARAERERILAENKAQLETDRNNQPGEARARLRELPSLSKCSSCGTGIGATYGVLEAAAVVEGSNEILCYRCMYLAPEERGKTPKEDSK